MKILLIGSEYNWSIELIYQKELIKLGHQTTLIPVQNWFYEFYYKSIFNKIMYRMGLTSIHRKIQKKLLKQIGVSKYDLIWVFKGMELTPETILKLKNKTNKIINFNPDNPFIFSGKGSGNINISKSIGLYDKHYTYDNDVKKKIELDYQLPCELVSFGFDLESLGSIGFQEFDEVKIICFLGNPDSYRAGIILEILNQEIPVHVYGNDWQRFIKHPKLTIFGPVYENRYYHVLRSYRLQLNIMRGHNLNSHNMRSIEVPGCGGIMLAPSTTDHLSFFEEGKEAFFYTDTSSLIEQAKKIMSLDPKEVLSIRKAAQEKVRSRFLYEILVKEFITN